jgi:hypothetical protein
MSSAQSQLFTLPAILTQDTFYKKTPMLAGMDWLIRPWRYFDSRLSGIRYLIAASSFYGGQNYHQHSLCLQMIKAQAVPNSAMISLRLLLSSRTLCGWHVQSSCAGSCDLYLGFCYFAGILFMIGTFSSVIPKVTNERHFVAPANWLLHLS